MDRREAVLREMHLYPLWVRRDMPVIEPVEPAQPEEMAEIQQGDQDGIQVLHETFPAEHEGYALAQDTVEMQQSGADTLLAFQSKIAAGPLAGLDWPELKQKVEACIACPLRGGCQQTVFGVGDEQADWFFVGEAPGAEEDASAEPFTGHAGRLLDNMLMSIGLKRKRNVYMANVIKCRPPEDRHPHVGEIAACRPFLQRQIELVKPKLIVALGKTAAAALLDTDATIASMRGQVHEYKGIPVIVSFHPAFLLRSPLEKVKAWQDLCLAVETMQRGVRP